MSTMLSLPPATEERLLRHSKTTGRDMNECLEKAVDSYLNATSVGFDAFLSPLRRQVSESGMSDAEVDELLLDAIRDSRAARTESSR